MPTIDDFDIPAAILTELRAVAALAKPGPLLALAKALPSLAAGVRLTAANARFIRQRLLPDTGRLRDEVRDFLAMEGLNGQLVMVLSPTVLAQCLPLFLAIHGRERVLAALLVDNRPEVRQLAITYCQTDDWQSRPLPACEAAGLELAETLQPFLALFTPLLSASDAGQSTTDVAPRQELTACRSKIAALEERLRHAKDEGKFISKLEAKIEVLSQQISELESKAERERQARRAADKTSRQAEAALAALRQEQELAIRAGVETEMRSAVRAWLVEPMRLASTVEAAARVNGADILDRVHLALTEQEERDRHYGNRRLLRDRLLALRQAEESLLRAASDSINPLPDLTILIAELQVEAARLEALLGEDHHANPVALRLAAMIRQATEDTSLLRIKRLLQDMAEVGILSPLESRALYQDYGTSLGRLFDRFATQPLPAPAIADPALLVTRGRGMDGRFLWILDGYNILLGLDDLFAATFEDDGRPGVRSRTRLLVMVDALLAGSNSLADVIFDGPVRSDENFSPRVKVIYSGGGGATVRDRADQAIVDCLESRTGHPSLPAIVVTDDQTLSKRCLALDAKVMPLQQFASFLLTLPDPTWT